MQQGTGRLLARRGRGGRWELALVVGLFGGFAIFLTGSGGLVDGRLGRGHDFCWRADAFEAPGVFGVVG